MGARASAAAAPKMGASARDREGLICVMRLWKADSQRETTADEGGRQKTNITGPSFYGLQLSSATKQK